MTFGPCALRARVRTLKFMDGPRVSIVVPLFEKAAYVERAIASILAQRSRSFEVIVVDDGSTDGGADLIAGGQRVRVVRQENAGPGAARNRGIAEARGEYIAFLDADDVWEPDYLEFAVAALDAHPDVAAVTSGWRLDPGGIDARSAWTRRGVRDGIVRIDARTPAPRAVALLAYMHPCATTVRATAIRALGGFYDRDRCRYGEDSFLFLQLLLRERIFISLEPRVRIDTGASALSTRRRPREIEPLYAGAAQLEAACPRALLPLLRDVLAIRAGKTACVMTYWGRNADARRLVREFTQPEHLRYHWVALARLAATPLGPWASAIARYARSAQ